MLKKRTAFYPSLLHENQNSKMRLSVCNAQQGQGWNKPHWKCVYVCVFVWWSGEGGRGIKDLCPYLYFLIMISRTAVLLLPSTCQSNGRCRREVLGLRRWSGEKGECEELWRWGGGHRSWMMGSSWPTESVYPQRWRGRVETQNKRKD